ncbi:hypothetical protein F66182_8938 [Fusarium sp. NRRL 66182]|nr:hypothetical protein F66182_8938 [Fusarium sp. NRRL 66182]
MLFTLTVKQKRAFVAILGSCLIFYIIAAYGHVQKGMDLKVLEYSLGTRPTNTKSGPAFYNMSFDKAALEHGANKTNMLKYQSMYDKYLRPLQGKPIKLLEIGLGCGEHSEPGASYYTWLEFLPGVDLYVIEDNVICAEAFRTEATNARIAIGDPADVKFLSKFSNETTLKRKKFDVIIDNGDHSMKQQITSLEHLWKALAPGGLYVLENLRTSYLWHYGGDATARDTRIHTTMRYVYALLDDMMNGWAKQPVSRELASIDCMAEICALRKK